MIEFDLNEKERYFTPREIAERFDVSNTAVNTWLTQGRLKGFRVGNRWKVRGEDIITFVQESTAGRER